MLTFFKATNIRWGRIRRDNTVKVTFDVVTDTGKKIARRVTVRGSVNNIQQLIEYALRERAEAIDLYRDIKTNKSLNILMTSEG